MRSAFALAALAALLLSGGSLLAQSQGPVVGALVSAVADGSPAQKAGITRGDIILSVDGKDVIAPRDVVEAIGGRQSGDAVSVKISHGNETRTVQVTLDARDGRAYMGILLAPPAVASGGERRNPDRDDPPAFAAIITEVAPGGPAAKAGLHPREVVVSVDGTRLDKNASLGDLIGGRKPGDAVTLSVASRGGETREVIVTLAQNPDKPDGAWLGVRYGTIASRDGSWPRMRNPRLEDRGGPGAS
jgi:serine protease Do